MEIILLFAQQPTKRGEWRIYSWHHLLRSFYRHDQHFTFSRLTKVLVVIIVIDSGLNSLAEWDVARGYCIRPTWTLCRGEFLISNKLVYPF